MTAPLALDHASRTFGNGSGIFDVELELAPGRIAALVGLNGAGKSTLMRVLLGMLRPQGAGVEAADHPVVAHVDQAKELALVHQGGAHHAAQLEVDHALRGLVRSHSRHRGG